jgi:hypothetical protein
MTCKKSDMKQGRIMSCMEVCPNACRRVVIFWRKNVHTIGGKSTKYELRWLINVSIFSILN